MKKWVCSVCGGVYDPAEGSPTGEVAGAAVCKHVDENDSTLPESHQCKACGASKEKFKEV